MSTNVFREALIKAGITNGIQLAERIECPAVVLFFAGPRIKVPYAELRVWDNGREHVFPVVPRFTTDMPLPARRKRAVGDAIAQAQEDPEMGVQGEWGRTPFPNCWMPKEYLSRARERYLAQVETP